MKTSKVFLALCTFLGAMVLNAAETEWTSLFNGKDLSGWQLKCSPQDSDKAYCQVKDGAIILDSTKFQKHDYLWLVSEKEYDNFEFSFKFKIFRKNKGNSGLQFRSRYDEKLLNGGWMNGPQMDIHPAEDSSWRTGLIYDETLGSRHWVFPKMKGSKISIDKKPDNFSLKYAEDTDEWNEAILICNGAQIKTIINGVVQTDWNSAGILDSENHKKYGVGTKGILAFQIHRNNKVRIYLKDIKIRLLDKSDKIQN